MSNSPPLGLIFIVAQRVKQRGERGQQCAAFCGHGFQIRVNVSSGENQNRGPTAVNFLQPPAIAEASLGWWLLSSKQPGFPFCLPKDSNRQQHPAAAVTN